jgi:hypothetical protein
MNSKGSMHKNMDERAKIKALNLLEHFKKQIKMGRFEVETAASWAGMGKSATLRIDINAGSYEDLDDIPRQ